MLTTAVSTSSSHQRRDGLRIPTTSAWSVSTKSSPTDPVTDADRAAEAIIVSGITSARPDDGIVGEEGADRNGTSGVVWYIDPIDGTTNYVHGCPVFSVSIALRVKSRIELGVVYDPSRQELFTTIRGSGDCTRRT